MKVGQTDGTVKDEVVLTGSNAKVDGATSPIIPQMLYNGATYDLQRNNTQGTLLASAARTATTISPTQTNHNGRGISVILDITAASGAGGLQIFVRGKDVNGKAYNLNTGVTAIIATGLYVLEVYPGSTGTTGQIKESVSHKLPRTFDVMIQHGDASSYTYAVNYEIGV